MMLNLLSSVFVLLAALSLSPASAGAQKQRIALMLTGSHCREEQQALKTTLRQTDGVFFVDGSSVPEHLLVDVEEGKTSAQDILMVVQRAIRAPLSCQIEIMQSCITAPRLAQIDAHTK